MTMNKSEQEAYQRAIDTGNKYEKKYRIIQDIVTKYLYYLDVLSTLDKADTIYISKVKDILNNISKV